MHVLNLDGSEALTIEPGKDYLVPTLHGIPVVWPAHVDDGDNGRTSRHYHADYRFAHPDVKCADMDPDWVRTTDLYKREGESIFEATALRVPTVYDDGRLPYHQQHRAVSHGAMSGEIFSSNCWLYLNLGHMAAIDGKCAHHATELHYDKYKDCLACPAHGLKYQLDGSPRYKAPFWLRVGGTMGSHGGVCKGVGGQRVPLTLGKMVFEEPVGDMLHLEDDDGVVIDSVWCSYYTVPGTLNEIEIKAWPKGPSATKFRGCQMARVGRHDDTIYEEKIPAAIRAPATL